MEKQFQVWIFSILILKCCMHSTLLSSESLLFFIYEAQILWWELSISLLLPCPLALQYFLQGRYKYSPLCLKYFGLPKIKTAVSLFLQCQRTIKKKKQLRRCCWSHTAAFSPSDKANDISDSPLWSTHSLCYLIGSSGCRLVFMTTCISSQSAACRRTESGTRAWLRAIFYLVPDSA